MRRNRREEGKDEDEEDKEDRGRRSPSKSESSACHSASPSRLLPSSSYTLTISASSASVGRICTFSSAIRSSPDSMKPDLSVSCSWNTKSASVRNAFSPTRERKSLVTPKACAAMAVCSRSAATLPERGVWDAGCWDMAQSVVSLTETATGGALFSTLGIVLVIVLGDTIAMIS